mmetsp:Transcript_10495/g.22228  ORF Transcript_10495/g.22228 Transcript_10495/m.22228 type:complete len:254 (+) Transcript_10495:151-912(+)
MIRLALLLCAAYVSAYQPDGRFARRGFIKSGFAAASTFALITPAPSRAFDGGVGGLGKTKPETGVVFRNADLSSDASSAAGTASDLTNELLAPDGTPAIVAFDAPWPVLKSSTGVESRDLQNAEAAFLQVAVAPKGAKAAELKKEFFFTTIFGSKGKYGAYGQPIDIKVKRVADYSDSREGYGLYTASFTTFTPGGRESERKIYITTAIVGNGVFMLITGSTAPRFRKQEASLRNIAESFSCVAAPKSSLRSS